MPLCADSTPHSVGSPPTPRSALTRSRRSSQSSARHLRSRSLRHRRKRNAPACSSAFSRRSRHAPAPARETPSCRMNRGHTTSRRARSDPTGSYPMAVRQPAPHPYAPTTRSRPADPARTAPTGWICGHRRSALAPARRPADAGNPRPIRSAAGSNRVTSYRTTRGA